MSSTTRTIDAINHLFERWKYLDTKLHRLLMYSSTLALATTAVLPNLKTVGDRLGALAFGGGAVLIMLSWSVRAIAQSDLIFTKIRLLDARVDFENLKIERASSWGAEHVGLTGEIQRESLMLTLLFGFGVAGFVPLVAHRTGPSTFGFLVFLGLWAAPVTLFVKSLLFGIQVNRAVRELGESLQKIRDEITKIRSKVDHPHSNDPRSQEQAHQSDQSNDQDDDESSPSSPAGSSPPGT